MYSDNTSLSSTDPIHDESVESVYTKEKEERNKILGKKGRK